MLRAEDKALSIIFLNIFVKYPNQWENTEKLGKRTYCKINKEKWCIKW